MFGSFIYTFFVERKNVTFFFAAVTSWTYVNITGSLMYSLAVSVKMNILLYSPALLIAYITVLGYKQTFLQVSKMSDVFNRR